jgi:hypothetical protein
MSYSRDARPMFRFTIRDVLWLTVVVAQCAILYANSTSVERHQRSTREVERRFIETVSALAKEKGEDIQFYTGRHHCMAHANGVVAVMGEGELP